jgi:hypothetical protein
VHCSANLAAMLALPEQPATGTALASIIAVPARAALDDAIASLGEGDMTERRFALDLTGSGTQFDCAVHRSGALVVIECEPHARSEFADHVSLIVPVIARLEQAGSLAALLSAAITLPLTGDSFEAWRAAALRWPLWSTAWLKGRSPKQHLVPKNTAKGSRACCTSSPAPPLCSVNRRSALLPGRWNGHWWRAQTRRAAPRSPRRC